MTTEELEKLGIMSISSKLYPRKYFVPQVGEVKIPESYTIEDIFELIYEKGYENGTEKGKDLKMAEIRSCLGVS